MHLLHLFNLALAAGLPDPSALITSIIAWVLKIVVLFATIYIIRDIAVNLNSASRDLMRLALDVGITIFLLVLLAKSAEIVSWAQTQISAAPSVVTLAALIPWPRAQAQVIRWVGRDPHE